MCIAGSVTEVGMNHASNRDWDRGRGGLNPLLILCPVVVVVVCVEFKIYKQTKTSAEALPKKH